MRGDALVERGATKLEELSRDLASRGGFGAQIAPELAEDAQFLRRLKPSLVSARIRGEAPANVPAASAGVTTALPPKPKKPRTPGEGPNPLLIVGGALLLGIVLAKVVDWRGHAHPRVD
jgi:hypothetical protein